MEHCFPVDSLSAFSGNAVAVARKIKKLKALNFARWCPYKSEAQSEEGPDAARGFDAEKLQDAREDAWREMFKKNSRDNVLLGAAPRIWKVPI